MANQYAVNHKKRHVTLPAKLTEVATQGGRLRVLYDTYTTSTTENGDIIHFGKLPGGCKVWDAELHISATMGSSTTLKLGYSSGATATTDDDGFLAAAASTTAVTRYMKGGATTASGVTGAVSPAPVSVTAESSVIATLGGANASDSVVVTVKVVYSID